MTETCQSIDRIGVEKNNTPVPGHAVRPSDAADPADEGLGRRLLHRRRFAAAHRAFSRAAAKGSRPAAEMLRRLGWAVDGQTPDMEPAAVKADWLLPSSLAAEILTGPGTCLVPDYLTANTLGNNADMTIVQAEPHGCAPETLAASSAYLTGLWETLTAVVADRLDAVHATRHGRDFWRRALGMGFHRHLSLAHDHFRMAEAALHRHPDIGAVTLDRSCYYVPRDHDDLHWFLSDDPFGQEQLFSIYCRCFYPQRFPIYQHTYQSGYVLAPAVTPPTAHQPVVGVLGSWFKPQWQEQLVRASGHAIQRIGYERRFMFSTALDAEKRDFLASPAPGLDRFANFFLNSLASLMPRIFIEDWTQVYQSLASQMSLYRRLKYVVSELWIGDAVEPIATAILMQRGVKLIFHEHNYSEHPYVGSAVHNWSRLCDIYLAHGSHGALLSNGVDGGSLYDFGEERPPRQQYDHDLLYISGLTFIKDSLASGSSAVQGYAGWAGPAMAFKRAFLTALDPEIRDAIHYRGYPRDAYGQNWKHCRDDMAFLDDLLSRATIDDHSRSGREVMRASRLVLISYLATSHLESLSMNIPTILLFTVSREYLSPAFRDFFAPLIQAGICQTDPEQAAAFVRRVHRNPDEWWLAAETQHARKQFLAAALGAPQKAADFLMDLALGRERCHNSGRKP